LRDFAATKDARDARFVGASAVMLYFDTMDDDDAARAS